MRPAACSGLHSTPPLQLVGGDAWPRQMNSTGVGDQKDVRATLDTHVDAPGYVAENETVVFFSLPAPLIAHGGQDSESEAIALLGCFAGIIFISFANRHLCSLLLAS